MKQKQLNAKGITTVNELRDYLKESFKDLRYDSELRSYMYNDKKLMSTSKYMYKHTPEFDAYVASHAKAKSVSAGPGDKRTSEYYRKRWELLADEGKSLGSRVHLYAECYPYFDDASCDKEQGVREFFLWLDEMGYVPVSFELKVFDKTYYKMGIVDLICLNKDTQELVMFDFKTNNSDLFKYNSKLLSPFNKYKDSKYSQYSLQQSHYKYMFESMTGLTISNTYLVWLINPDKDFYKRREIVGPEHTGFLFEVYKCIDMTKEIDKDMNSSSVTSTPAKAKYQKKTVKSLNKSLIKKK